MGFWDYIFGGGDTRGGEGVTAEDVGGTPFYSGSPDPGANPTEGPFSRLLRAILPPPAEQTQQRRGAGFGFDTTGTNEQAQLAPVTPQEIPLRGMITRFDVPPPSVPEPFSPPDISGIGTTGIASSSPLRPLNELAKFVEDPRRHLPKAGTSVYVTSQGKVLLIGPGGEVLQRQEAT